MTPYIFGVLEFVSAAIYGKSSAQVVGALVDVERTRLRMWLPIAVLSYFSPDTYVFLSVGRLPGDMLALLTSVVCVTLVLAGVGMIAQIWRGRRVTPAFR